MGILSSKLAPMAIKLAWICQRLLDPKYSSIVPPHPLEASPASVTAQQQQQKQQQQQQHDVTLVPVSTGSPSILASKLPENNNSLHQENRNRRAAQLRFKTRPSSFDAALIVRSKNKNAVIVASSPSLLRRPNMRMWNVVTSSSGCSSDSGSNSDTDSETELRVSENVSNTEEGGSTKLGMSAEEEEAFRLTVGRGHFTRSKKDRFLNHLRLEKRLNDLNNEYFGIACANHHRQTLQRRHSGDLHRII